MVNPTPPTPSSSPEVGRLFNLDPAPETQSSIPAPQAPSPAGLPVAENNEPELITHDVPIEVIENQQLSGEAYEELPPRSPFLTVGKKIAPYLVVFAIGIGLYYFYFSDFSFTNLFRGGNVVVEDAKTNAALEALKQQESENYSAWISQFFFDVTDQNIIAADTDVSGNGLTNFQKYLLNLNPKLYDTLGDGTSDGQKIIDGRNPWTGLAMTDEQKKIADTYFDNEVISNRLTAAQSNRDNTTFAPYVSNNSPFYQAGVSNIRNGDSPAVVSPGTVAGEAINTPPSGPVTPRSSNNSSVPNGAVATPPRTSPLTGVTTDAGLSSLPIDTNVPGRVDVPSVNASVPLIWSKSTANFDSDLKRGVIHYPGTPLPGGVGTSYISGHSSGYFYDKSIYKQAFARLGEVKNGDSFRLTVTLKGGKQAILHYRVDGRAEYAADDQRQFLQSSDSVVALSTCWPLNTTARRLVLFGVLTQIER